MNDEYCDCPKYDEQADDICALKARAVVANDPLLRSASAFSLARMSMIARQVASLVTLKNVCCGD